MWEMNTPSFVLMLFLTQADDGVPLLCEFRNYLFTDSANDKVTLTFLETNCPVRKLTVL